MAILSAHLLNGKIVGIETPTYSLIEQPFKIESNTPSPGYVDVSSIKNWWDYGLNLNRDFIFVRKEIMDLVRKKGIANTEATVNSPPEVNDEDHNKTYYIDPVNASGEWTGYNGFIATWKEDNKWIKEPSEWLGYRLCTNDEKFICGQLKIGSQGDHFKDFGVPDIYRYGLDYHDKCMDARRKRLLHASVMIYNYLPLTSSTVLTSMLKNPIGDLTNLYHNWGIKGTLEDFNIDFNPNPAPGIIDYICGRTPFDGNDPYLSMGFAKGLALQDWITVDNQSMETFSEALRQILVDGIY